MGHSCLPNLPKLLQVFFFVSPLYQNYYIFTKMVNLTFFLVHAAEEFETDLATVATSRGVCLPNGLVAKPGSRNWCISELTALTVRRRPIMWHSIAVSRGLMANAATPMCAGNSPPRWNTPKRLSAVDPTCSGGGDSGWAENGVEIRGNASS